MFQELEMKYVSPCISIFRVLTYLNCTGTCLLSSIIHSKDKSPSLDGVVFKWYRILKWRGRFRLDGGVVNIVSVFKIKKDS
jgi:hypothetical protein